jgi:Bacterial PH domain
MALPITGDYFAARHEVSEEGLRDARLIGSGGLLRWDELKSVRFSQRHKWFRLESQSGGGAPSIRHVDGTARLRTVTSGVCAVGRDRSGDPIDFADYD